MNNDSNPSARYLKGDQTPTGKQWDGFHNITFDVMGDDSALAIQQKPGASYRPYCGDILIPSDFAEDVKMPAPQLKPAPRFWEFNIIK